MTRFSVKKPLTVFVAVIAVLVLGVVAYLKMTPDLLPNMDFPYVIIITAYPGATPEKVESEVSKPMEQAMSTLEHIKEVTSTSQENASTVLLEFEESVNMDTIGVDIQQQITSLSAGWEDMVQTPYVLKINPSMLPVEVAALSMEGMDTIALTEFVNDTLMTKLEGIPGVARISPTGMVEQELHVILDQKLIDAANQKVADAINKKLDDAIEELEEKKQELEKAKNQLTSAESQITAGVDSMADGLEKATQLKQALPVVQVAYDSLSLLEAQKNAARTQKELAQRNMDALDPLLQDRTATDAAVEAIDAQISILDAQIEALKLGITTPDDPSEDPAGPSADSDEPSADPEVSEGPSDRGDPSGQSSVTADAPRPEPSAEADPPADAPQAEDLLQTDRTPAAVNSLFSPVSGSEKLRKVDLGGGVYTLVPDRASALRLSAADNSDEIAQLEAQKQELLNAKAELQAAHRANLEASGFSSDAELQDAYAAARQDRDNAQLALDGISALLSNEGMDQVAQLLGYDRITLDNLPRVISAVRQLIDTANAMGSTEALKIKGILTMSSALAKLAAGASSIDMGLTQLESGFDQIEDGREDALRQADLEKIITMDMVSGILKAQNFAMPAGYVEENGINYMVSVGDEIRDLKTLEELLLFDMGMEGVDPIYLRDVAIVTLTDNRNETYAKLDRQDGVMLSFEKQSTYATAETTNNIQARFRQLEEEYPGLKFVALMNQGDYIYLIVDSILSSLLLGAVFAIIVLFLFLRDLRPTFITLCSIPISVIFAIVLMYFSGVTINMISLSGLAVAVGMLVDNSVVVIENIYRLRAKGANVIQASVSGAMQVAGSVTASTLTTVCVFLPIVFVEGITKQLFTDLALTMSYSLLASLLVSLTLVPAMASGMLRREKAQKPGFLEKIFLPAYERSVRWALEHKLIVLAGAAALLVLSAAASLARGFIFMPEMDMPNITVSITMPEGADMEQASALADQVLDRIAEVEGISTAGAMMNVSNTSFGGMAGTNYNVTVYINLSDETASGAAVGREIEKRCEDLDCTVSADSAMLSMDMLTGSGVSLNIYAEDMDALQNAARIAGEALEQVEGIDTVSNGLEDAAPALHIAIDRNEAMRNGLTVAQVYMELAAGLTADGTVASLELDGISTDVIIEKPAGAVLDAAELRAYVFEITDREGEIKQVPLSDFATVEETASLSTIQRINQRRYLTVSAQLLPEYNVTLVTAAAQSAIDAADLGPGVSYTFTGENESIMDAVEQLLLMLVLGMMLVYLVMVAQFQSLKSPFIVMFTIPLAFTGGFMALLLLGMEVSVISLIGFVMLTGIIVNNGIVLVDYINQLRLEGSERRAAIVEAGSTRMRPILMTTITTVLGLIDMAIRKSAGTALMKPIAVVCIGGLVYATLMTLYVVPCIYDLLNRKELRSVREEDLKLLDI